MSGSPECASDSGPGGQEGNLGESVNEQLPQTSDTPVPDPDLRVTSKRGNFVIRAVVVFW